uniref:Uncharacterized protein n=1 Tax=Solanum lycopersicum TaxID=4081 RepID=A0A3Q7EDP9_SOLLC
MLEIVMLKNRLEDQIWFKVS